MRSIKFMGNDLNYSPIYLKGVVLGVYIGEYYRGY